MSNRPYQMCAKTVMDTTDPDIVFDDAGISNHYHEYQAMIKRVLLPEDQRSEALQKTIDTIKNEGKGKQYDCILGLSGGLDSSYVAYLAGEHGLRPLVVHFDNGWNSELAVKNIEKIIKKYNFDLYTIVVDWNEFKDIQRSYFKASVINIEAITDHAITATMFNLAYKNNIKYVMSGSNVATESILPYSWAYPALDLVNIKGIQKRFGTLKIKTLPRMSELKYIYYLLFKRFQKVKLLNLVDYNVTTCKAELKEKIDWEDYGSKHQESIFTKWYQGYYIQKKFNIDKRKAHYSSMILAGQMTRDEALENLKTPVYNEKSLQEDTDYICKKLGFSTSEFAEIINAPGVSHTIYPHSTYFFKLVELKHKLLKG
jgi:N-acetyl sugar amidotransferase